MTNLDQNFTDLANILMQRRQMQHQAEQQQFTNQLALMNANRQDDEASNANRLSDLQYTNMAEDYNYKQGLRGAMANPTSTSVTSVTPATPQLSLASLMPGQQLQPPQFQPDVQQASPLVQAYHDGRVSTQTTNQTPGQAGAAFAMKSGRPEDAAKIINMDDVLAQYGAKVAAGQGDPQEYYKRKNDLDMYKQFLGEVTPLLKTAQGRQLAQTIGAKYQQMNPSNKSAYDVSTITTQNDSVVNPLTTPDGKPAGTLISMPDGTTHYEKPAAGEGAHNVQEIPSADGKSARKMQYNPQTQRYDIPLGGEYKVRSQVPNINVVSNRDSKGALSDDAVGLAAETYLTTGKMPAFGNGGAAQKMTVLNKAASLAKERGLDASGIIAQAADTAAQAGGLKKVTSQFGMVQSFEKTANKNFDLVERLYDKNPQTTVMLLNKLKNNINTKIVGDPDTVMAGRALQTALMEYAKVVTGQTGGAAVSDSARKEVESLLSLSDKPETFHGTIANHRLEMKNRMDSFQEVIANMRSGAGGGKPSVGASGRPLPKF